MVSLEVLLTSCADLELDAALPAAHASLALFLCSKATGYARRGQ